MVFSSVQFLFVFLPLCLAVYYVLPRSLRNWVLCGFSVLFCLWAGVRYTALLLAFAALNWVFGLAVNKRHGILPLAVTLDLLLLGVFKYSGFLAQNLNALPFFNLPVPSWALPLGISFYVFQAVGYCVDVAKGRCAVCTDPIRFFVYLCFFGHLSSGPLITYADQAPALDPLADCRRVDTERFCYGIKRFVFGLSKKALLADQLALIYGRVTAVPQATVPGYALALGYLAYDLYLYFDFSGYSDMAVGLGAMFGLPIPENFDYPFLCQSVGEFWRRWHITLSGWFKKYVYIPLGGSRKGTARTCLNLLIVFLLTGFWHGAAWKYVVFGLVMGLEVCAERLWLNRLLAKAPAALRHFYAVILLYFSLILFAAPNLPEALAAMRGILTLQKGYAGYTLEAFADTKLLLITAIGLLLCGVVQSVVPGLAKQLREEKAPSVPCMVLLLVLLFFGIMWVTAGNYTAFIYQQF